jgi:hypothetical protein
MKTIHAVLLVPVYQRLEILEFCYLNWVEFAGYAYEKYKVNIFIYPICSVTEDVAFIRQKLDCRTIYFTKNIPLGRKMNTGMLSALSRHPINKYIITTGSDDTINQAGMDIICEKMIQGKEAFGFTDVIFKKWGTDEQFSGRYDVVCGAFRTIKASILKEVGMKKKYLCTKTHVMAGRAYEEGKYYLINNKEGVAFSYMQFIKYEYALWPDIANQGLDTASGMEIEAAGYHIEPIQGPYVTDHKSDLNIHSFESIKSFIERPTY